MSHIWDSESDGDKVERLEGELKYLREDASALVYALREYTNDLHFFGKSEKLQDVLDALHALEHNNELGGQA